MSNQPLEKRSSIRMTEGDRVEPCPRYSSTLTRQSIDSLGPFSDAGTLDVHVPGAFDAGTRVVAVGHDNKLANTLHRPESQDTLAPAASAANKPRFMMPILWLNVVIHFAGHDDELPIYIDIARHLQAFGHRVRIATYSAYRTAVVDHGVEFFNVGESAGDIDSLYEKNHQRMCDLQSMLWQRWLACVTPGDEPDVSHKEKRREPSSFIADVIIADEESLAHIHCAEKLGIPLHIIATHADQALRINEYQDVASAPFVRTATTMMLINSFRREVLELEPIAYTAFPNLLRDAGVPVSCVRSDVAGLSDGGRVASPSITMLDPNIFVEAFHAALPLRYMLCSLDERRPAVWRLRKAGREIHLSAFAASVLMQEKAVKYNSLRRLRICEYVFDHGPIEPFSGSVLSVTDMFVNFFRGVGEVALDASLPAAHQITSRAQHDTVSKTSATGSHSYPQDPLVSKAMRSGAVRGSKRAFTAVARSPMTFTLALAEGAHNAPKLWGDKTVRDVDQITGLGSGIMVGGKRFFLATYDGVAGLIAQPYIGAREEGAVGLLKGLGKGVIGFPFKWLEAAAAPAGYPLKGVEVEVKKALARYRRDGIDSARLSQGELEYLRASADDKETVLKRWRDIGGIEITAV